jgi:membrane-associated phospholipid phosphatase
MSEENINWRAAIFGRAWIVMFFALMVVVSSGLYGLHYAGLPVSGNDWKDPAQVFVYSEVTVFILFCIDKSRILKSETSRAVLLTMARIFHAVAYLFMFSLAIAVLTYLTVMMKRPLIDGLLVMVDSFFLFDWLAVFNWISRQQHLSNLLFTAYNSMAIEGSLVVFFTAIFAPRGHLDEFAFLYAMSLIIVVMVASFFPAEGAFFHYGKLNAPGAIGVSDFRLLRAGLVSHIDIRHLQGLVSMPSFHACMAIMFSYALRSNLVLFSLSLLFNGLVLVSAIYCGGHYLSDLLASSLMMALLIWFTRRLWSFGSDTRRYSF